jgi:hypothetical protein
MNGVTRESAIELLRLIVSTPSINPAFRTEGDDPSLFGEERLALALMARPPRA